MPRISFRDLGSVKKYLHRRVLITLVVLAILVAGLALFLRDTGGAPHVPASGVRTVEIKSVAELSSEASPLSIVGSVTSRSEASVRAESSGQVTGVYRALGDSVGAGTIIAEIDNASQRAAVLQAKGSVDAAEANLAKVHAGTRPEQISILESALEGAKAGAVNTLLSAYTAVDNALPGGVDAMFAEPDSGSPRFRVTLSDFQLGVSIENTRTSLGIILKREAQMTGTLSTSADLIEELNRTQGELRTVRDFLDNVASALNKKAVPTTDVSAATIATYQATAISARASVNSALSSVASARQTLQTASKNLEQGVEGPVNEDVAAAEAAVTQAKGAYAAALANLEKTIIRAPIAGTINSLSLKRGDYVSQTTPVVTVANNGALEVLAYVTEQDVVDIAVGNTVTLENGIQGTVTRIAPALDPVTKKIEVRIGVNGGSGTLVNGQSVTVTFLRKTITPEKTTRITIPISAIKIGTNDTTVFTVDEQGVLVAHVVTLGELLGDRVVVRDGVTLEMRIVTDARGLRAGQTVQTK